ncbi:patatin-like phospholipase family protein [Ferviditalea candida]|uniref:Patatin family protein n=1 Tax=Ferviditalea candida TaxID=3108399 RepID=A0ABU5ZGK7_9BACL|nr:patatin family protein [Paenibacillaceae bacterium T2]
MEKIGLVLEGGGMKGVFTGGVLDLFIEKNLFFPYVIGVSAGACNALSYMSKQYGRNKRVTIDYISDPRYLSYRNLLRSKSIFGMDFIFDEIPNRLDPFDYESFQQSEQTLVVGTTDCFTGEPVYFSNKDGYDMVQVTRASSSLPFVALPVELEGYTLMDGGMADPLPIRKSIEDGNRKHVVVMTKHKDYVKRPFQWKWAAEKMYPQFPGLVETMIYRHENYNETLRFIRELEEAGKVFVIQPETDMKVSRIEKKRGKLTELYEQGYRSAETLYEDLLRWMETG